MLAIPGAPVQGTAKLARPTTAHNRQQFAWRDPGHPLIRKKYERSPGVTVYSGPIEGHVLELLLPYISYHELTGPYPPVWFLVTLTTEGPNQIAYAVRTASRILSR